MAFIREKNGNGVYHRIVSLVPSLTELLHYLRLEEETVGITRYCTYPLAWHKSKPRVGGTKNADLIIIRALAPDLIIASREENVREQVDAMAEWADVLLTDIVSLADACVAIRQIGALTNRLINANKLADSIWQAFQQMPKLRTRKAAYFIWRKPWMVAGGDTFISHMMGCAGFKNVFAGEKRYPGILLNHPNLHDAECFLLSSEPFPFRQKHVEELSTHFPEKQIVLTDGTYFSWYGSRLLASPDYFATIQGQLPD